MEGERKLVTVLFADVANYTSMSENLDPEEVHQIMDGCFKILMGEIHKYEGTINQFTGDGVMALFGAPVGHEDHAQRACYAALSIQMAVGEYEQKIEKDYGLDFKMRVGLNSGHVIVGAIGNDLLRCDPLLYLISLKTLWNNRNIVAQLGGTKHAIPNNIYCTSVCSSPPAFFCAV